MSFAPRLPRRRCSHTDRILHRPLTWRIWRDHVGRNFANVDESGLARIPGCEDPEARDWRALFEREHRRQESGLREGMLKFLESRQRKKSREAKISDRLPPPAPKRGKGELSSIGRLMKQMGASSKASTGYR